MKANYIVVFISIFLPISEIISWNDPSPKESFQNETRYMATGRLLFNTGAFSPMIETSVRDAPGSPLARKEGKNTLKSENSPQRTVSLLAGSYYRLDDNIMVGAFYRGQTGARHNNDWVGWGKSQNIWEWSWLDTKNRMEHSALGDITFRGEADFLPGENWIFEWKNRFQYTYFTEDRYASPANWGKHTPEVQETVFMTRPGIYYFLIRNDAPFMTFFFQSEIFFPMNFGETTIHELWIYSGFLYHLNRDLSLAFTLAQAKWIWSTSESIKNIPEGEICQTRSCRDLRYTSTENATILGLTVIYRWELKSITGETEDK